MNTVELQDDFLKEIDFIRLSVMLKPVHTDFLKTIDQDNISKALRMVIDGYMKQTKMLAFQKYVLYLVLILCILTFGFLIYPILTG